MGTMRPDMTPERIAEINRMIEANPEWNRSKLSQELCKIWDWRRENGQIKDVSCRDVLRALDASGKIRLPKGQRPGRLPCTTKAIALMIHDDTPIKESLTELMPLSIDIEAADFKNVQLKSN
jgi:hypothetical protein